MSTVKDRYRLKTPCSQCPFRSDKPFPLKYMRAKEIVSSLRGGGEFSCHKTTEETGSGNLAFCAGAAILLEKTEGPNQMMRISERLGIYDPSKLDMDSPVYDSFHDFIKGVATKEGDFPDESDELDYCGVADYNCTNPAGYGGGGGVSHNEDPPECSDECEACGSPMCDECRVSSTLCSLCGAE